MKKINLLVCFIILANFINLNCMQKAEFKCHVKTNSLDCSINLSDKIIELIKSNQDFNQVSQIRLNDLPIFNTKEIKKNSLKEIIEKTLEITKEQDFEVEDISIRTEDQRVITCTYLKRNKNKIVIAAPGFGDVRDALAPFTAIFSDCDILFVNYWGNDKNASDMLYLLEGTELSIPEPPYYNPIKRFFSERFKREKEDIKGAIRYINHHSINKYNQIIGFGNCYSTYVLVKAQSELEKFDIRTFDKLILDSCWFSTRSVAEKVAKDPYLSFNQSYGGAPALIQTITKYAAVREFFINLAEFAFSMKFDNYSLLKEFKKLKLCSVLFIIGSKDLLITKKEFKEIWNSNSDLPKLALITPFEHTRSHLKAKEIYKFICQNFINTDSIDEASENITSYVELNSHKDLEIS